MDQPSPDLFNATFHHSNFTLGYAAVRLETQINLCVVRLAVLEWKLSLNHLK